MSSFDPASVQKAVAEFMPRRPRRFHELYQAKDVIAELRQKGASYRAIADLLSQLLKKLARLSLLVIDDLGIVSVTAQQYRDLLEVLDGRHGQGATLITSQLPVEEWHQIIGDATVADAIMDRLAHNDYRITLQGESVRKLQGRPGAKGDPSDKKASGLLEPRARLFVRAAATAFEPELASPPRSFNCGQHPVSIGANYSFHTRSPRGAVNLTTQPTSTSNTYQLRSTRSSPLDHRERYFCQRRAEVGFLNGCRYLLQDRDAKSCEAFTGILEAVGISP